MATTVLRGDEATCLTNTGLTVTELDGKPLPAKKGRLIIRLSDGQTLDGQLKNRILTVERWNGNIVKGFGPDKVAEVINSPTISKLIDDSLACYTKTVVDKVVAAAKARPKPGFLRKTLDSPAVQQESTATVTALVDIVLTRLIGRPVVDACITDEEGEKSHIADTLYEAVQVEIVKRCDAALTEAIKKRVSS